MAFVRVQCPFLRAAYLATGVVVMALSPASILEQPATSARQGPPVGVGPASVREQRAEAIAQVPLVALDPVDGGFFVLASHLPFRVSKAQDAAPWFEVEPAVGLRTEPRMVSVAVDSSGLSPGTYYSALRIEYLTAQGGRAVQIPVAVHVPGETGARRSFAALAAEVPSGLARLQVEVPGVAVRFKLTPARHYIIELVDRVQESQRLDSLSASALELAESQAVTGPSQTYELVFPWMCLELCGRYVTVDAADVTPNLDAVNAVSYERFEMIGGSWGLLNVGDPGDWASDNSLLKWPMLIGGYKPSPSSVKAMWDNRAAILAELVAGADAHGYHGYNVDVEGHASSGKDTFINLMDYLADGLHAHGYRLMVAHATWATLAPIEDLAATAVDYVVTMDPYTGSYAYNYIPDNYAAIEHDRLVWAFTWDNISDDTQTTMWDWMEANGYNDGVAGAAVWRTPLMPPHGDNNLDYYEGLRRYYPKGGGQTGNLWQSLWRGNQGWYRTVPVDGTHVDWDHAETWAGPLSLDGLPGSGAMQSQSGFVAGSEHWQSLWRRDRGWYRTVPVLNGTPDWGNAGDWGGPVTLLGIPGSGSMQSQSDFVAGSTLWQSVWRADQGWYRTVPIVGDQVRWGSAGGWRGPVSLDGLPGSGGLQAQSDYLLDDQILYQTIWRSNWGYTRHVPVVDGAVQWALASDWSDPVNAIGLPGSGAVQAYSETVIP